MTALPIIQPDNPRRRARRVTDFDAGLLLRADEIAAEVRLLANEDSPSGAPSEAQ